MARNKQTARKSTGGKAPRKTRATPTPPVARPVPTGVFLRDFVKKSREKIRHKENKAIPSLKIILLSILMAALTIL